MSKLQGIRVLDLTSFLPGPYMTLLLADHGAEVIKVEAPGGDHGRQIGIPEEDGTTFFRTVNRGKRSVKVDLKQEAGREALLQLCDTADVFVESFRPGVADRLGIGDATVRARNPGIVYCSISAFGQDGPLARRPAHDLAVEAMAGVLSVSLGGDGAPAIPGIPASDLLAGLLGLSGVLMALLRRAQTGLGDRIDVSMHEAMLSASVNVLGPALAENRQQVARHERTTGGSAFYRLYRTADGRHVALAGQEEKFVRALLAAIGREDLVALCLAGPGTHQVPAMQALEAVFAAEPLDHWTTRLAGLDVCFGPVLTFPEALAEPHVAARGTMLTDANGRRSVASPIRFTDEPSLPGLRPPALGEGNAALLGGAAGWAREIKA